jgi:hypothetical protein
MDCKNAQILAAGYLDRELDPVRNWRLRIISMGALSAPRATKIIKS